MRRLWVQLSLAISGLIAGVIVLILITGALIASSSTSISDEPAIKPPNIDPGTQFEVPTHDDNDNNFITEDLLIGIILTVILSGFAGIVSGVVEPQPERPDYPTRYSGAGHRGG